MSVLMKNITLLFVVAMMTLSTGCASVVKGTTQDVPISSEPSGADVLLDGNFVGTTPTSVKMRRKTDHLVTIQKDGYEARAVPVVKNVGGAVWGNIIAGGLVGWGVDAVSGAQYNLTPETIFARLQRSILTPSPRATLSDRGDDDSSIGIEQLNFLDELHDAGKITDEEYALGRKEAFEEYFPELIPPNASPSNATPAAVLPPVTSSPVRSIPEPSATNYGTLAAQAVANAAPSQADQDIRKIIVSQSIQSYSGNCPCPYNFARNGSRCGGRSAYSRKGGASPLCYEIDVTDEAVRQYRASARQP